MKQRFILAVESANLTAQDKIRLMDLDGTEYDAEMLFKRALKDALQDREGNIKAVMGTFAEWVKYVRENVDFKPEDYTIISVEIDY